MTGKQKLNFATGSTILKVNKKYPEKDQKVPQKCFHTHSFLDAHSAVDEQCETYEQLKERETLWKHKLKTFYPISPNEKEE